MGSTLPRVTNGLPLSKSVTSRACLLVPAVFSFRAVPHAFKNAGIGSAASSEVRAQLCLGAEYHNDLAVDIHCLLTAIDVVHGGAGVLERGRGDTDHVGAGLVADASRLALALWPSLLASCKN